MPELTMKQIMRASSFAVSRNVDLREIVKVLQSALKMGKALDIPADEIEEIFYRVGRSFDG